MTRFTTLLLLSGLMTNTTAFAITERDVSDCEFIVDDLAVVTTSAYGAVTTELVAQLLVRPDLNLLVSEAGAFFHFAGRYKKISTQPDGTQTINDWQDNNESLIVPAQRTIDGQRLKITFQQGWNTYGNDLGDRRIQDFTFYITVRHAEGDVRYWFKDKNQNLGAESLSSTKYFYSDPVFLGGYSNARYLWRDSGSPVFSNRAECLEQ